MHNSFNLNKTLFLIPRSGDRNLRIPYLGKIRFFWCNSCQVPLIRAHCGLCKKKGRKVNLSPPGDVRPAMEGDLERMVAVIKSQFGQSSAQIFTKLVENQVIFLNKVPYVDRMDEIIIQGDIVGIFRFNLVKQDFELLPRVSLAMELWNDQSCGWIAVDDGAREPILKGAAVLSPGIVFSDPNIKKDDPVIVVNKDQVIAVGLAKAIGSKMGLPHRGVAVKTKYRKIVTIPPFKSCIINWDKIIDANSHSLKNLEKSSIDFIKQIAKKFDRHVVAYSGGKDSLVTLDLVSQSHVSYNIIFSDTGLEYPETLENIEKIARQYQKKVISHKNKSWNFWERFEQFGPPSVNSRWCCKSAKLSPVNEILDYLYPNDKQILSFIGKRRYESFGRSQEPKVSKNPWIPKQITASPINNWNAFEVFLYVQKHNLTEFLNPLYTKGFIRIGCWVCPASSMSDFRIMKESHPSLINKLNEKLLKIQCLHHYPYQYVSWGLWRWKYLPKKILNLLESQKVIYKPNQNSIDKSKLLFRITSSPSPCVYGGYSIFISANQLLDLSKIADLLPILGSVQYKEEYDVLSLVMKNSRSVDIFPDGSIIIASNEKSLLTRQMLLVLKTIYRIMHCDGCGICTYQCKEKALVIKSGIIRVLEDNCVHCLKCNDFCPLLQYSNNNDFILSKDEYFTAKI